VGIPEKEPTTIGVKTEGPTSGQLSETSDPVVKKAKITGGKNGGPGLCRIRRHQARREQNRPSFEIICGHVKGKKNSGEATDERPFLYLAKEDEAFIVGGNQDSMAAIVYRAHCISANCR
jgi:hypothetical protein